jgi:Xaa-Pro dipeptidase
MIRQERLDKTMEQLEALGLSQMMICDPNAVFYLTGKWIHPGERFLGLLLQKGEMPVLFVNELFTFEEELGVKKVYYSDADDLLPIWKREIRGDETLGIDKVMAAKFLLQMMEGGAARGYRNGSPVIDAARSIKDAAEIELMRESSRINDLCMEDFKRLIRPDVTELEVAEQMLTIYKSHGAEGYSFDPIVAFGRNAADPHHMPDNTVLKEGDTVLFDVGGRYHDYCSDMTRTFFYKAEPSSLQKEIYNLVRRANEEAEAMLRPGIPISSVDKKARDIITEGGYGPYFTHRLGHFIGIEDHEYGDVSQTNSNLEEAGIIHSVEPGIYYMEGGVGVRIEDLVLITPDGHEVLNHYSHEIEIIE